MPALTPIEIILASLNTLPNIGALATALGRAVGQALERDDLDEERDDREQRR